MSSIWLWVGFNLFVIAMLALDLGVFHKEDHAVSVKEASIWSVVWISLAMVFNIGIYFFWDKMMPGSSYSNGEAGLAFFTGYLIEKSLSVDNIFVFVLLFSTFAVPAKFQHRVLFWGIFGALVMRGIMIAIGASLIHQFHWVIYIFGAFLIFTGLRMAFSSGEEEIHPEHNPLVKILRRVMPVSKDYEGHSFFVKRAGTWMATPLFVVLLVVESTDLIFAVDSIPAIFAVTDDPFLVYTSNVFAILGLRSLYFVLAGVMHKFHYLKMGLAGVLSFVGVKMLLSSTPFKIDTMVSLFVIAGIISAAVIASMVRARRIEREEAIQSRSESQVLS
jgi:integral membrane protein, TerC family